MELVEIHRQPVHAQGRSLSQCSTNHGPWYYDGRTLRGPTLKFGGKDERPERPGVWNMKEKKYFMPAMFENWTVVCFAPDKDVQMVQKLVLGLWKEMQARGMNKLKPHFNIAMSNPQSDVKQILKQEGAAANASLILVILPEGQDDLWIAIKRFGDIEQGVSTQCVKWTSKLKSSVNSNRGIIQYYSNVVLKINLRLGGINFRPDKTWWFKVKHTMILGADVSHPGLGNIFPSVSALVGSVDPWFTRYVAATCVQEPRCEIIQDISSMFEQVLEQYIALNRGTKPDQLIFYRDGVSEGEFNQVKTEISGLKCVLDKYYDKNKLPKLNYVIVGKKHHIRFFTRPGDSSAADKEGNNNLFPGFVADGDIVHPIHADFYLQSQAGLKGTSRPTHYTVLRLDSLSINDLQELTFQLCHCYLRSTRSVKIPAPVYYIKR